MIFGFAVNLDVDNCPHRLDGHGPHAAEPRAARAFRGLRPLSTIVAPPRTKRIVQRCSIGQGAGRGARSAGFARDVLRGRTTSVQILVEGTNSNTAALVVHYAGEIIAGFAQRSDGQQTPCWRAARGRRIPEVAARTRVWFNPDLKSRNYFVPGVIANIIMMVTLMLTAMAIVREKEIGTMEQLMVTPIRPIELMIGKTLPFAVVGLIDVVLISDGGAAALPYPAARQPAAAAGARRAVPADFAGRGTVHLHHLADAAAGHDVVVLFRHAGFMLSGFAFPIHNMPPAVQYLTFLNPLRYFVEIVRGIFLKGTGYRGAVAADAGAGGLRRGGHGIERAALPQAPRLSGVGQALARGCGYCGMPGHALYEATAKYTISEVR